MTVLIIDNYDSFTFNLYQALQAQTEREVVVKRNDAISFAEILNSKFSAIVLSPGPGHPSVDKDFGVCKEIVVEAAALDCPVLGVCLGHQGIAYHLGGRVEKAPRIVHGKTSRIAISKRTALLQGVEDKFEAMRYHSFVVSDQDLPQCLEVTARDTTDNLVMALQHKTLPIYGLQFHPESIGTAEGQTIVRNFLALC